MSQSLKLLTAFKDGLIGLKEVRGVCCDCCSPPSPQEAIQLDGEILYALLHKVSPAAHRHLKKHNLEPILYMTEWFMCAFSRTLPWASVLRIWDMFLCEGKMLEKRHICRITSGLSFGVFLGWGLDQVQLLTPAGLLRHLDIVCSQG